MAEAHDDPRIYFAAERTFLAWLRTGLALMGIGFAVSRFGLFLRQIQLGQPHVVHSTGASLYSGVALVLLGVLVNVTAVVHHVRTTRRLRAGTWTPGLSFHAVTLALLLAAVGTGMAIFLLVIR
jgi:putative membrane protein